MKSENGQFLSEFPDIMNSLEQFYMITRTDTDGMITYANKSFLATSKWTPKRIIGKSFWHMFSETENGQNQADTIWRNLARGKSWYGTAEKITRSGQPYFVNMLAIPILQSNGNPSSYTFLERDITDDVHSRNQLQQAAFIDFETGLLSRYKLELTVNAHIEARKQFSFVFINIDHYYTLKDLHSPELEKELIKSFSNRLKRYFQNNEIARVGVNQFVVLTPFGDWYIQGFLDFLEQQPIYINHTALPLSVSGGIVRCPEDQKTFNHLMMTAITATTDVIQQGGRKIVSLSTKTHQKLNRQTMIDKKMLTALNLNNLQVVYQPQLDIASGQFTLYEALVRWEDDELGYISPDELIPIAEENGLIHEIGAFVLEEATKLASVWEQKGQPIKFSVNSSVREFGFSNMKEKITHILAATACSANQIQLEITEKFALQAEEEQSIIHQMKELQDQGIEFALDDFGTGFASFRYMQNLPISKIKIDKVFTNSLLSHPKTQQLVRGMIQFGKSMGLYVIAEGVETEDQFVLLKEMGVDAVQGYYIGVPVTADKVHYQRA